MSEQPRILVLGIGNLLWADEGFGVRAAEALASHYEFPANVTVLDGGTQGLYLLPFLEEADALIVFDAVDYGLEPGTIKEVRGDQVPAFMGAKKTSLHQTGFQEVIATAMLLDRCPAHLFLIGVQPAMLEDYGGGLTPETAACIEPAVAIALRELAALGAVVRQRAQKGGDLTHESIGRVRYEGERPSAADACRFGDERFLPAGA